MQRDPSHAEFNVQERTTPNSPPDAEDGAPTEENVSAEAHDAVNGDRATDAEAPAANVQRRQERKRDRAARRCVFIASCPGLAPLHCFGRHLEFPAVAAELMTKKCESSFNRMPWLGSDSQ